MGENLWVIPIERCITNPSALKDHANLFTFLALKRPLARREGKSFIYFLFTLFTFCEQILRTSEILISVGRNVHESELKLKQTKSFKNLFFYYAVFFLSVFNPRN